MMPDTVVTTLGAVRRDSFPSTQTQPPPSEAEINERLRSAKASRNTPPPPPFSEPRWVMMRSLVVPGWGQLHNGSWLKALAIAASEGTLIALLVEDTRALDRLERDVAEKRETGTRDEILDAIEAYNSRLDTRTQRSWWLGGVVGYSLLDAYVDAHFRGFSTEFGAALMGPASRSAGPARDSSIATRLALRWHF